jgi:lysophospholipid acyltransferase (LPLAT)-like uncharacterized protein
MPHVRNKVTGIAETDRSLSSSDEQSLPLRARRFTLWQRVQIAAIARLGSLAVGLIGRSLRWQVYGLKNWASLERENIQVIFTFWHSEIFAATWYWRRRNILVLTSQNFDGEYIGRIIIKHGYGAARGSSSRGGARALVEMIRWLRKGGHAAVTVDGPRGPRRVVKPGVVTLARSSGAPLLCFHIVLERAWIFRKSWDKTEIPKPFSRAAIFIAPPFYIPADADEAAQTAALEQAQSVLDTLEEQGEDWKRSLKRT